MSNPINLDASKIPLHGKNTKAGDLPPAPDSKIPRLKAVADRSLKTASSPNSSPFSVSSTSAFSHSSSGSASAGAAETARIAREAYECFNPNPSPLRSESPSWPDASPEDVAKFITEAPLRTLPGFDLNGILLPETSEAADAAIAKITHPPRKRSSTLNSTRAIYKVYKKLFNGAERVEINSRTGEVEFAIDDELFDHFTPHRDAYVTLKARMQTVNPDAFIERLKLFTNAFNKRYEIIIRDDPSFARQMRIREAEENNLFVDFMAVDLIIRNARHDPELERRFASIRTTGGITLLSHII